MAKARRPRNAVLDTLQDWAIGGLFGLALCLPWRARLWLAGVVVASLVAPLAGYRRRIRDNLARIWPDLPPARARALEIEVCDNLGRTLIEIWSGAEFKARVGQTPLTGPGIGAIRDARAAGRGVLLVAGHFGNHDAVRAAFDAQGMPVGGLFNPMRNPRFDTRYRARIHAISTPLFPRDRRGLAEMVRHLRGGGLGGIMIDQHMAHGEWLRFFGHPARTALSAAEMALKYDLLLVPINAIRQPDGVSFVIEAEAPIPHTDARQMTQALNDSLEALVRRYPGQWFWVHRRWRVPADPEAMTST